MLESQSDRFTLRKEYFVGLVYDSAKAKVELLYPPEYNLLMRHASAEEQLFESQLQSSPKMAERLKVFRKVGFIDVHTDGRLTLTNVMSTMLLFFKQSNQRKQTDT
jgi:hypothetical protein